VTGRGGRPAQRISRRLVGPPTAAVANIGKVGGNHRRICGCNDNTRLGLARPVLEFFRRRGDWFGTGPARPVGYRPNRSHHATAAARHQPECVPRYRSLVSERRPMGAATGICPMRKLRGCKYFMRKWKTALRVYRDICHCS
jgi:hypothetical protein